MVQAVYENYKNNPSKFVNHDSYGLNKKLDFEGKPVIPQPSDKNWSNISFLGWPSLGLGNANANLGIYNAVANNGVLVKPICVRNKRVEQNHC
jgi:cell division protein FtsI (penicillin-binding protein 3)